MIVEADRNSIMEEDNKQADPSNADKCLGAAVEKERSDSAEDAVHNKV